MKRLLLLAGWLMVSCGDDRGDGNPRPDAAVEDAGVQDGSAEEECLTDGCNFCGLSEGMWENPLPTGDDIRDKHAFTGGGAVVGGGRSVHVLDGETWTRLPEPPGDFVRNVGGSGPRDVWISDGDLVYRWDGAAWTELPEPSVGVSLFYSDGEAQTWVSSFSQAARWNPTSGEWDRANTQARFVDVLRVFSSTDAWVGADNGQLSRFDGEKWLLQAVPTTEDIVAIEGTGASDLWVITDRSTLLHRVGETWETVEVPFAGARSYEFGLLADGRMIARTGMTTFQRFDGESWLEPLVVPELSGTTLAVLADDRLLATGQRNTRALGDFATFDFNFAAERSLRQIVSFAQDSNEWALATDEVSSRVLRRTNERWEEAALFDQHYRALAVAGDHAFVAGDRGRVQVWDGAAWTAYQTGTQSDFFFAWADDATKAYALARDALAVWDGERWVASGLIDRGLAGGARLGDGTVVAFEQERLYQLRGEAFVPLFTLSDTIRAVGGASATDFWISTSDGLFRRKGNRLIEHDDACGGTVGFAASGDEGSVWFGATSRIARWNDQETRVQKILPAAVTAMHWTGDRLLVGTTYEGIYSIKKEFEPSTCTPQCPTDVCGGYDGCGGLCEDSCEGAEVCQVERTRCCEPRTCEELGRTCGTSTSTCGVLVDCGECAEGMSCAVYGECTCEPACDGKSCGLDLNCGKYCGECGVGGACENGQCELHGRLDGYSLVVGRSSPYKVAPLTSGGYVTVGAHRAAAIFGDGQPAETTLTSSGEFVARYGADHQLRWASSLESNSLNSYFADVSIDESAAAAYVAGSLEGNKAQIARFSLNDGNVLWSLNSTGGSAQAFAVAQRPDQSLVVVGSFRLTMTFHEGTENEVSATSNGESDIFIASVSVDGIVTNLQSWGDIHSEHAVALEIVNDDLWIAGYVDGPTSLGGANLATSKDEVFVVRTDASANTKWLARAPRRGGVVGLDLFGLAVASDGTAFLAYTGAEEGALVSANGAQTLIDEPSSVVAKLSSAGHYVWVKTLKSTVILRDATLFDDGRIAVGGSIGNGPVSFGEFGEPDRFVYRESHRALPFVGVFGGDGIFQWMQVPAVRASTSADDHGWAVTIDSTGSLLLTGELSGSRLIFGPGQDGETLLNYEGEDGIPYFSFVARLSP